MQTSQNTSTVLDVSPISVRYDMQEISFCCHILSYCCHIFQSFYVTFSLAGEIGVSGFYLQLQLIGQHAHLPNGKPTYALLDCKNSFMNHGFLDIFMLPVLQNWLSIYRSIKHERTKYDLVSPETSATLEFGYVSFVLSMECRGQYKYVRVKGESKYHRMA